MQSEHKRITSQIENIWQSLLDKRKNYVQKQTNVSPIKYQRCTSKWDIISNQKEKKFSKHSQLYIQPSPPLFPSKTNNKPQDINQPPQFIDNNMNKYFSNQNFTPQRAQQLPLQTELNNNKELNVFKNVSFIQQTPTINSNNNPTINPLHLHKANDILKEKEMHNERSNFTYQDKAPLSTTQIKQLPFNITNSNVLGKKTQREVPKETSKKNTCRIDLNNAPKGPSIQTTPQHFLQEQPNHNISQV